MPTRRTARPLALLVLIAASLATLGAAPTNPYSWFEPLVDVQRIITDRYVVDPDAEAMQRGAIRGMVEALNDPYTEFIPAESLPDFDKQIRGRYVGIGASVIMEDGEVTIVSPLDDSPAFHAGIMAGDKVIAVDGDSVMGMSLEAVVDLLSGEPGSEVLVTVRRGAEEIDIPVVRDRIVTRTVSGWRRAGDAWDYMIDPAHGVGYARLSQFNASSPDELRDAINAMRQHGTEALVLDLRFNPGGLLVAATQIADMFLETGLIVSTKGRIHEEQPVYATRGGEMEDLPIIVLVNRQSASGSEVLAGALRDNDRAIVLGTRTFGKGAVQNIIALPSGAGQLKVTEQHYYGPSGRKIHRDDDSIEWGVDPSPGFLVTMTDSEYNRMLRIQRDNAIIRTGPTGERITPGRAPDWIIDELGDRQLALAVDAAINRLEIGQWSPVSEVDDEQSVEVLELRRMERTHERILRDLERVRTRIRALSSAAPEDDLPDPTALVPEGTDLSGGRLELYDSDGNRAATLRITGRGLERWLIDAPVEPAPEQE